MYSHVLRHYEAQLFKEQAWIRCLDVRTRVHDKESLRQFPGGELPRDHPAPLRRTPPQGHFHTRLHVRLSTLPVRCQGHGGYWQDPQGA